MAKTPSIVGLHALWARLLALTLCGAASRHAARRSTSGTCGTDMPDEKVAKSVQQDSRHKHALVQTPPLDECSGNRHSRERHHYGHRRIGSMSSCALEVSAGTATPRNASECVPATAPASVSGRVNPMRCARENTLRECTRPRRRSQARDLGERCWAARLSEVRERRFLRKKRGLGCAWPSWRNKLLRKPLYVDARALSARAGWSASLRRSPVVCARSCGGANTAGWHHCKLTGSV